MDTGAIIEKYIRILGAEDVTSRPSVTLVKPKLGRHWLGIDIWSTADPETTSIQIDERVAREPRSFERILAHEIIHHVNWIRAAKPYMSMLLSGSPRRRLLNLIIDEGKTGHGAEFMRLATIVNAAMGEGFVTQFSDQSYEYEANKKFFYMLIVPIDQAGARLGYKWGIKPSARALKFIHGKLQLDDIARLVKATGEDFTHHAPGFLDNGWAVPRDEKNIAALRHLYDHGERFHVSTFGGGYGIERMRPAKLPGVGVVVRGRDAGAEQGAVRGQINFPCGCGSRQ